MISKNRRAFGAGGGRPDLVDQARAVEDVVAQDQRDRAVADELAADDERVGKAARASCSRIGQSRP